ncbi:MAG TPA: tripartite tricarboxylate transporter permease [Candidatus Thalassarchaeaceae archaeon]|nr:tripartite tricarboxylate transporter permease [Candidatus Thalassarchaeaceae archaeon]HJM40715.1 tripartite tricarboxylate transporter permease [Candidatus Thalassarchaeaceae archaeon]
MLEGFMLDWAWLMGSFFIGIFLGCMTGLIPGFHVNNVALIALSMSPLAVNAGIPLSSVAAIIVSMGTVHTFLNYIPSALIGAPDGDTALALLPGHRMLISGHAAQGVAYSARGSQLGLLLSIPLLIVARLLFGTNPGLGLYELSRDILPWLLLAISAFLILTETTRLAWPRWIQKITSWAHIPLPRSFEFTIPIGKWKVYRKFEAIDFRLGDNSRAAGMLVATAFFLLAGFYGWAVFELPGRSPVGMPSATLLMPALAGLFGIANLIDIYVTTSEMPPQEQNWDLPPVKPLIVPCLLSSCCAAVMAILPGMTAAQATVVVMSARNFWGRLTDPDYIPADFEYGPGGINDPAARARIAEYRAETARLHGLDDSKFIDVAAPMIVDEAQATAVIEPSSDTEDSVDSSDDWDSVVGGEVTTIGDDHTELVERTEEDDAMLAKALEVKESSPELDDLDAQTRQQDLEVIAVLSATNTAVTVMVLTFLYLVLRPRSGAALALNMMYPIDQWTGLEPPSDYIRLMAITIGAGLFAVPVMIKVGQGMLKLHELIPLRSMVMGVVGFVTLLVWLSTGWIGIGVLIVGTAMGLMPPRIGIRRSHGMGIILVPIMIYTFAQKLDGFGFI